MPPYSDLSFPMPTAIPVAGSVTASVPVLMCLTLNLRFCHIPRESLGTLKLPHHCEHVSLTPLCPQHFVTIGRDSLLLCEQGLVGGGQGELTTWDTDEILPLIHYILRC